ncbi:MAG: 6,7-dimethyl-8-ribityllumazine synthase [Candidatus Andersenbacteria bacterium]|nr:6,7-dimethyl-8-ribityllumazine synthase [Candidatus Andersenbacteria bacterium]
MQENRLAIVAADFHKDLTAEMVGYAKDEVAAAPAAFAYDIRVAGSYETPLVAATLLRRADVDAVVVLGYIEKGETLHGEVMGHAVFSALIKLQLKHQKPVGLGIIGPGATAAQAAARAEPTARGAVRATLRSLAALQALKSE